MISKDTKNIIKGIGIATIIFGAIYIFSISKKKKNKNSESDDLKDVVKKEPEVLIDIINPDVMNNDAGQNKDAFAHADGNVNQQEEPKIKEPTMPLSEQAEDALRWFVANNYEIEKFSNASEEEILMVAKKAGWKGGPII